VNHRRPVGIFDSGVGGLTVFRAVRRALPGEDLLYFGDTAHVPYGARSPEVILDLARAHFRFLASRGVKCIVVACNTASAVALPRLERGMRFPMLGVIGPGVGEAVARTRNGRVGVLGTAATVASGAYQQGLLRARPGLRVFARACPLFVPLIEEGWTGHAVARRIAAEYLKPLVRARVDTVILGCTHYPLLKGVIRRILGPEVALVDSAEAVASRLSGLLRARGLTRPGRSRGRETFFLTDTGGTFRRVAERFLGRAPRRVVRVSMRLASVDGVRKGKFPG